LEQAQNVRFRSVKFHFIVAVWGEAYVTPFLDVIVPNLLSAGNLPAMRGRDQSTFCFYTAPDDVTRIESSPAFARLTQVIPTKVVSPSSVDFTGGKHQIMAACHRAGVLAADGEEAAIIFLPPDTIWSDGTFRRVEEIAETGKRLLAVAGLRVVKETFVPEFLRLYHHAETGLAAINSRELVKLSLKHLHPITQRHFWDSPTFCHWSALLLWGIGNEGILARNFHLHPLMVNPPHRGLMPPEGTVDDGYVQLVCPSPDDLYLVTDSDEITLTDISAASQSLGYEPYPNTASVLDVACWARRHTNEQHRRFVQHTVRFHTRGVNGPAWDIAQRSSDEVVTDVLAVAEALRHPKVFAKVEAYTQAEARTKAAEARAYEAETRADEAETRANAEAQMAANARASEEAMKRVLETLKSKGRWRRFLKPSFLARKLREDGLSGCVRKGLSKVARRLVGQRRHTSVGDQRAGVDGQ
jgi:hypothetical protein